MSNFGGRLPYRNIPVTFFHKIHPLVKEKKSFNDVSNFGRGSSKEHSCIFFSKSIQKSFKGFFLFIFSPRGHHVQRSGTVEQI